MVCTKEDYEKNTKINSKKVIFLLFSLTLASILIGFFITQFFIKPYLAKISSSTQHRYSLRLPELNYYQVKIGEYNNENDAMYNLNLLIMKGIYSESFKTGDKYILSAGCFMDKNEASGFSSKLNKSGVLSSVIKNNGPIYEISYEKNSKSDIDAVLNYIGNFDSNLSHLSELSYKIAIGDVSEKDIDETESYFKKSSDVSDNIKSDKNLKKIVESIKANNDYILSNFKDIKTSFELGDGNAYSITQKLFINSVRKYYDQIGSLK